MLTTRVEIHLGSNSRGRCFHFVDVALFAAAPVLVIAVALAFAVGHHLATGLALGCEWETPGVQYVQRQR